MVTELSLENILHPEIYRISSEQTFEKYCHRRVLITGFSEKQPFLAMIDQVNGLGKGDQVELHFQINYTKVRLDGQTMTFWDSGAPSLIVVGDGKLKPSFRHGWISDMMDQKRPSLILDFCEEGGEATRYFATVLVPVKAGKHANLRGLSVDKSGFNMELNGQTYHFDIKREKRYECRK